MTKTHNVKVNPPTEETKKYAKLIKEYGFSNPKIEEYYRKEKEYIRRQKKHA